MISDIPGLKKFTICPICNKDLEGVIRILGRSETMDFHLGLHRAELDREIKAAILNNFVTYKEFKGKISAFACFRRPLQLSIRWGFLEPILAKVFDGAMHVFDFLKILSAKELLGVYAELMIAINNQDR